MSSSRTTAPGWLAAAALAVAVMGSASCGSGGGSNGSGMSITIYTSTCEQACQKRVTCGDATQDGYGSCVTDCKAEPWAGNYRACRALTCGLTEAMCEKYGIKTCEQACQNQITCGEKPQSGYDACVADCKTEPWAGNYIDCRATLCGATEAQCETFHGT